MGDEGAAAIAPGIAGSTSLVAVDLAGNAFTAVGMRAIAQSVAVLSNARQADVWRAGLRFRTPDLSTLSGLRGLRLSDNPGMGDAGVLALCKVLRDDAFVYELDLSRCGISIEAAGALQEMLVDNGALVRLDLAGNALPRQVRTALRQQTQLNRHTEPGRLAAREVRARKSGLRISSSSSSSSCDDGGGLGGKTTSKTEDEEAAVAEEAEPLVRQYYHEPRRQPLGEGEGGGGGGGGGGGARRRDGRQQIGAMEDMEQLYPKHLQQQRYNEVTEEEQEQRYAQTLNAGLDLAEEMARARRRRADMATMEAAADAEAGLVPGENAAAAKSATLAADWAPPRFRINDDRTLLDVSYNGDGGSNSSSGNGGGGGGGGGGALDSILLLGKSSRGGNNRTTGGSDGYGSGEIALQMRTTDTTQPRPSPPEQDPEGLHRIRRELHELHALLDLLEAE